MVKKLILFLFIFAGLIIAGETGRIAGRVVDAKTGEPLIGVDVIVEGTPYGAATDENGNYLIINVPVGTYTVAAHYIGYTVARVKGVKVLIDQTTTVDFRLKPAALTTDTVTVTAKRQLVIKTAVQTARVVSTKEFTRLPVNTLGGVVSLQAGVSGGHFRGGRTGEVAYVVDGISTQDPFYKNSYSNPSTEAIKEVIVLTGGFDAEYGDAMSGVVQVVTREGEDKFSFKIKYLTDELFGPIGELAKADRIKAANFGYDRVQGHIGGRLVKGLYYFVAGDYYNTEDYAAHRYKVPRPNEQIGIEGKLTLKKIKGFPKITVGGNLTAEQWKWYSETWRYWLDHYVARKQYGRRLQTNFNWLLGTNTVIELKAGYFYQDVTVGPVDWDDMEADSNNIWRKLGIWKPYIMKGEKYVLHNDTLPPDSAVRYMYLMPEEDAFKQASYGINNPYGVYGMYVGEGDYRLFHFRSSATYTIKGDLTYNYKKTHEFKTGFETKFFDLKLYENSLPWDPQPFWDAYNYHPMQLAYYVQDRADFEGLILRIGLRFDYLDSDAYKRMFPDSLFRTDTVKAKPKFQISPRLGIAFPITDRIKFRFSYGHFFQTPGFTYLYESLHADIARRGNIIVGDPDLDAEKTIAYETGFEAQLSDYLAFDFTVFYKDIYGLLGTQLIPALPISYYLYQNMDYGRVKGFEITFRKVLHNFWYLNISYTYQIAKGTGADPWSHYLGDMPQKDYYLSFDRPHTLNINPGISLPRQLPLFLGGWDISFVARYVSGTPYTPTNERGERAGEYNSARRPATFSIDSRIYKSISLGRVALTFYVDIYNILNTELITNVHSATGSPSWDGRIITPSQFPSGYIIIVDIFYHPAMDTDHDGYITSNEWYNAYMAARKPLVDNVDNYGNPRIVRLGISIEF